MQTLQTRVRPIVEPGLASGVVTFLLAGGTVYWLRHCIRILTEGLGTLGIDTYGATWGILVANTVHIVGISHVGIAISAAVRVLRLDAYRNIARTAEIVTLLALGLAVVNLMLHVGRPVRFLTNVYLYGRWHSPMVWSMTVFTLYFLASSAYLYLSMRRDLSVMAEAAPRFRGFYRALSLGYRDTPGERERHERTLFWLALALLPIMISVHSVYGLLFGMISARAGWYNPLQAPYFVLGAVVSGFSAIVAIAALLRRAYGWRTLLPDRLFRVFGIFLAFVVFLYLYFMLSEHLTAQYLPPTAEQGVSSSLLTGRFSAVFWATTVAGLVLPFLFLFVQGVRRNGVHVGGTAAAALLVNVGLWIKRSLLVVPSQYHPHLAPARPPVPYVPTHTEWVAALGSYVAAAFAFVLLLRLVPLFELPGTGRTTPTETKRRRPAARQAVLLLTLAAGATMILWGVMTRDGDFAPLKWLLGITLLVALPVESCLIGDRREEEVRAEAADPGGVRPAGGSGRDE
jgi:molybdopterin-containing oxidoreductase family membrane subunit